MKTGILVTFLCWTLIRPGAAQSFAEKITKELSFEKKGPNNTLMVFNINGDVKVEGYSGDKILIDVEKKINGKTKERIENGKQEIQLGVLDRADTLLVYVKGICSEFGRSGKKNNWQSKWNGWGYNWGDCGHGRNDCKKETDYQMAFTLKRPPST